MIIMLKVIIFDNKENNPHFDINNNNHAAANKIKNKTKTGITYHFVARIVTDQKIL